MLKFHSLHLTVGQTAPECLLPINPYPITHLKPPMPKTVISVENLTKRYDLGVIGTGTLTRDLNRWWARVHNQPDPHTKIGQEDKFKRRVESILALDDTSFTMQQGETLGIIGKNSAGKSTLLKILSRVTAPTSSVVKVKGRIGSLLEVGNLLASFFFPVSCLFFQLKTTPY